jgi:hypothetical protein
MRFFPATFRFLLIQLSLGICCGLVAAEKPAPKVKPPSKLLLFPASPCYQIVGNGPGTIRVDAQVELPAMIPGSRLELKLTDSSKKVIQTFTLNVISNGILGVQFKIPLQSPGVYDISAGLMGATGAPIAVATTDAHVIAGRESRVVMGPDGFLRVNGRPSFPIGMYSCSHYEEMGRAGFSVTHNYPISAGEAWDPINPTDIRLKQLLDNSLTNGMRMMVELPRKAIEKGNWAQVSRRIETFRHHPGLLCWGSEERVARGTAPLKNICVLHDLVRRLDPDHPLVLGDTRDVIKKLQTDRRDFFPDDCMDVGIWWWYPIPLSLPDGNGLSGSQTAKSTLEPPSWLVTTHSHKPLWIAIQAYQKPKQGAVYPTPREYRSMAYLSIINNVKGLFFYTGSGQKDFQGKPAGLLNKLAESHWDYVQTLVTELKDLSPVIMAPKAAAAISVSPASGLIEFTTREMDGRLILIAANKSQKPVSASFTSEAFRGRTVTSRYETFSAAIQGESLNCDFEPLGAHVFQIEPGGEASIEEGFLSLFNGKDLTGWGYLTKSFDGKTESDDGRYSAANGVLTVHPHTPRLEQTLWTAKEFPQDFTLKFDFRAAVNADSGVFLRKPQLQVRDYLVAGPYRNLKKYKPQDWNEVIVTVTNNVARCVCNGEVLEEAMRLPSTGPIGIEADRGQVEYRRIRVRESR